MTEKNKGGRPPKYKTVEELQSICDAYKEEQDAKATVRGWELPIYTMSGLARRLGMSRQALIDYTNKDEFLDTIKEFRDLVHENVEERLMSGVAQTGAIFNLKNNFGWKDKSEVEKTGTVKNIIVRDNRDKKAVDDLDSI